MPHKLPGGADRLPEGLDALNPLFQHRTRLGLMVLLAATEAINFTRLRTLLQETDGNLGAQLRKLEEAGYLETRKEFIDRKPVSWFSITSVGRYALKHHLNAMETIAKSVASK